MLQQKKQDEYGCVLIIDTGLEAPDLISDIISFDQSETTVKGTPRVNKKTGKIIKGLYHDTNLWMFRIIKKQQGTSIHLNVVIEELLNMMDQKKDTFKTIFRKFKNRHIKVYAYFNDYNPYFKLDRDLIKRLSNYNIDLEFDLYFLGDDPPLV
jgi:hypothetical protein